MQNDDYQKCAHCGEVSNLCELIGQSTDNCPHCGRNAFTGFHSIEQKRAHAQQKIEQAEQSIQRALNCNLAGYIVRARRNALAVACSDAALLEAHIILESQ